MKIKKRKKRGKKKGKKEMNDKRGKVSYESNAGVRSFMRLLLLTFDTVAPKWCLFIESLRSLIGRGISNL